MTFIRNTFSEEIMIGLFVVNLVSMKSENITCQIGFFIYPFPWFFYCVCYLLLWIWSLIILRTNLALVGHCELWGSWAFFLTKRDNSSWDWISTATRNYENYKMASRSPGGLEWSISIKPLLIAPSASLDVEILPKFCKSITLRYGIENLYVTL